MAPTPSSKVNQAHLTQIKTPQSKLRLHYNNANKPNPSSNPNTPSRSNRSDPRLLRLERKTHFGFEC